MLEIIKKLYENGFDFEYENFGGNGESVECLYLGLKVSVNEGMLKLNYYDETISAGVCPQNYQMLARRIDQIIILETTGNP